MTQEDALSAEYLLLTTLVYKVAAAAILATMLVRFGQFRRILLTEERAWRERLTFAFAFGIPVMIGVIARLALGYDGADLSLAGAFLAGLIAGPYAATRLGYFGAEVIKVEPPKGDPIRGWRGIDADGTSL